LSIAGLPLALRQTLTPRDRTATGDGEFPYEAGIGG